MRKVIPANKAQLNISSLIEEATQTHEPILITSGKNNGILLSQEDWNAIAETIYLNSIPGMAESIKESMNAPDSEFSEEIEW